jgi:hypothetical protein
MKGMTNLATGGVASFKAWNGDGRQSLFTAGPNVAQIQEIPSIRKSERL